MGRLKWPVVTEWTKENGTSPLPSFLVARAASHFPFSRPIWLVLRSRQMQGGGNKKNWGFCAYCVPAALWAVSHGQ
jgi:hypothetical protein